MKKRVFLIFIAIMIAGCAGWYFYEMRFSGPRLVVAKHIDIGNAEHGAKMKVMFDITNNGSSELQISNLRTSCGCLQVGKKVGDQESRLADNENIAAHSSLSCFLDVFIKINDGPNRFSQTVQFDTNDPSHSQVVLTITGGVTISAYAVPPSLVVEAISPEEEISKELLIVDARGTDAVYPLLVASDSPSVKVGDLELLAVPPPGVVLPRNGRAFRTKVTIAPLRDKKKANSKLTVSDGVQELCHVVVSANARQMLTLTPSVIQLPIHTSNGPLCSKKCFVTSTKTIEAVAIQNSTGLIATAVQDDSHTCTITVGYQRGMEPFTGTRSLQILCKYADATHLISLPVTIIASSLFDTK